MEEKEKQILETLNYYKELLEQKGYKVIYVALYGSQNYNVDDEKSDIDAKAIVLPTLSQIIHRQAVSFTLETKYGAIDYKDIITFNDVIRKGNFSYIEAIQSNYRIGDLVTVDKLFGNIKVNFKSIIGAMLEKRKALTHEYPSKISEFKKWHCDPKQFHHIVRLYHVLSFDMENQDNRSFLVYEKDKRELMIKLKRELLTSLEETEEESDDLIKRAEDELKLFYPDYKYEPIDNHLEIDNYIEEELRKELSK